MSPVWLEAEDYSKQNVRKEIHRMHGIRYGMQIHVAPSSIRKSIHTPEALQGLRLPAGTSKDERSEAYDLLRPMLL